MFQHPIYIRFHFHNIIIILIINKSTVILYETRENYVSS